MFISKSLALTAAIFSLAGGSAPASAVTFASYGQTDTAQTLRWVNGAGTGQTTSDNVGGRVYTTSVGGGGTTGRNPGSTAVAFNFQLIPLSGIGTIPATFTLLGSSSLATTVGGPNTSGTSIEQAGIDGVFSFISSTPLTSNCTGACTNLLTATFTNGRLVSTIGANTATLLLGSGVGQTLVYNSDFLNFTPSALEAVSFTFAGLDNLISVSSGRSLRSTRGAGSGNFGAPDGNVEVVPEPRVWALMIVGFGLVGVAARKRNHRRALIAG